MKRFYTQLIPYLSIRDTRVHDIKSVEVIKMENENKELKEKQIINDERLDKLENLLKNIDEEKINELLNQ